MNRIEKIQEQINIVISEKKEQVIREFEDQSLVQKVVLLILDDAERCYTNVVLEQELTEVEEFLVDIGRVDIIVDKFKYSVLDAHADNLRKVAIEESELLSQKFGWEDYKKAVYVNSIMWNFSMVDKKRYKKKLQREEELNALLKTSKLEDDIFNIIDFVLVYSNK